MKIKKERYVEIEKGFIYDNITKLLWHPNTILKTWEDSLGYAISLDDYGLEWRLPKVRDLINVVNYKCIEPASKLPYMSSSYYWSSGTHVTGNTYAWLVNFTNGNVGYNDKTNDYSVRCVSRLFKSLKECKSIILK